MRKEVESVEMTKQHVMSPLRLEELEEALKEEAVKMTKQHVTSPVRLEEVEEALK